MIVTRVPLRISWLGGGTDFPSFYQDHGGLVLSSAIDKFLYVILKKRFDDAIYINYSRKEIVDSVDEIEHDLVREAMRITGVERGIEITTLSDVPSEGSGLGSSSSVTVGLLHALYTYRHELVTAEQLATEACRIELEILGRPIGRQDQYIAAFGDTRMIEFPPAPAPVRTEPVSMDAAARRTLEGHMMLFYTGQTRSSAEILTEQVRNIEDRTSELLALKDLAVRAQDVIVAGDMSALGALLDEGWQLKRGLATQITNPLLDEMYATAREAGALGGKVVGAGGGGFMLLLVAPQRQDDVRRDIQKRQLPVRLTRYGSTIVFQDGEE